jgi:hypothetical protein
VEVAPFAWVQGDDLAVEGRGDEFYGQRLVYFQPGDGQPAPILHDDGYRHLVAGEGVVRESPFDAQMVCRALYPQARQQIDGKEEIGDGEEKVHAQDGGDDKED